MKLSFIVNNNGKYEEKEFENYCPFKDYSILDGDSKEVLKFFENYKVVAVVFENLEYNDKSLDFPTPDNIYFMIEDLFDYSYVENLYLLCVLKQKTVVEHYLYDGNPQTLEYDNIT